MHQAANLQSLVAAPQARCHCPSRNLQICSLVHVRTDLQYAVRRLSRNLQASLQIPPALMRELDWEWWPGGLWCFCRGLGVKQLLPVHDPSLRDDVHGTFDRV